MSSTARISVSELISGVPLAVRPTVQAARRMVQSATPKAREISYQSRRPRTPTYMWKLVRYTVNGANLVGIGTFPTYATLFFYRGRELDDGSGLLQGAGKDMRFIKLHSPADVERPAVRRLVQKAFKLGGRAIQGDTG